MTGAFSLFLGLLGLGAAGAVSAGQNAKIKKADYQYGEEHGLHGTSEVLQMRERVRKEWWNICGKTSTHVSGLHRVTATSAEPRGAI